MLFDLKTTLAMDRSHVRGFGNEILKVKIDVRTLKYLLNVPCFEIWFFDRKTLNIKKVYGKDVYLFP